MFKLSTSFVLLTALAALAPVQGAPALAARQGSDVHRQNALDAQRLNAQYATIKATDSCRSGENACVDGGFAQCIAGKWVVQPCAGALCCYALPLVNAPCTSNTCDTQEGAELRFKNAGVQGGTRGNGSSSPPAPLSTVTETATDCGLATSSTPVPRTVVSAVASSSAVLSSSGIPTSRPTASSSSAPITLVAAPTPSSFTFELSPTA